MLRVFVSSTSEDLKEYRAVARLATLDMNWHPEMMEHVGPTPTETVDACYEKLKECGLLLLIVAFRRGWVPTTEQGGNGQDSITALELDYAREHDISVLALLATDSWPGDLWEHEQAARDWIEKFRQQINLPAGFFDRELPTSSGDLPNFRALIRTALSSYKERLLRDETTSDGGDPTSQLESARQVLSSGQVVPPMGTITVMFTDIVDSTRVKRGVGDEFYFHVLELHNALVRNWITRCKGTELRTSGDGFFVIFADARDAVDCAIHIQKALSEKPIIVGNESIKVRIGLHTGTPKIFLDKAADRYDLSGTDADKAARVEGLARGGQVLISEETYTLAKPAAVRDWGLWELKGLGPQRIFEVLYAGKAAETPVGRMQLEALRFPTPFVGRERQVQELRRIILEHRLVTITGIGGIGKTRLADFIARQVSDLFDDGTFFIELATVNSTGFASEIAARLGVNLKGFKDESDALLTTVRNRNSLLVLDNFEHLAASARPLVETLFLQCPALHIVITSQLALNIGGEQLYPVPLLEQPRGKLDTNSLEAFDAFRLFRDRARLRVPDWDVKSPAQATSVAEILCLTDGIPLSVEFVAALVGSLTLEEIKTGLENRLEFLKTGQANGDARHASINASLEYSFGLLPDEARQLLPSLGVFVGGFFAEDVEAITVMPGTAGRLMSLAERNFLVLQEMLGRGRYLMLATVQDFAAEKLKPAAAAQLRYVHAQYFLNLLKSLDQQLRGNSYKLALERLDADLGNFEAGTIESQRNGDHRAVVDYATSLADYFSIRGRFDARLKLASAARAAAESLGLANMAGRDNDLGCAFQDLPTGDRGDNLRRAIDCFEAALLVWTERDFPQNWAMAQNNLGNAYQDLPTGDRGDNLRRAIDCFEAALRVWTERDFPQNRAMAQSNLGNAYQDLPAGDRGDNMRRAIDYYQAALLVLTESDFPQNWALAENNLGNAYRKLPTGHRGDNLRRAIDCLQVALRVWTERDFPQNWAMAQNNLGNAYQELLTGDRGDNLRRAIDCYQAALRVWTERDFPWDWATIQNNLGNAYLEALPGERADNLRRATDCYQAALRVWTDRKFPAKWALAQYNLGRAYQELSTGDRGDNLQRALACYEAATRGYEAVGMKPEAENSSTVAAMIKASIEADRTAPSVFRRVLRICHLVR
jgi:predicted ATPase/class 3 adenylate cyclase